VEIAERFVEGLVDRYDFDQAMKLAVHASWAIDNEQEAPWVETSRTKTLRAAEAVEHALWQISSRVPVGCVLEELVTDEDEVTQAQEYAGLSLSLRCIFGNPFPPVAVPPAWQTANVVALAQAIYDERAFDRMPILADALEDAGCANADILNHCRQPAEHVRGC